MSKIRLITALVIVLIRARVWHMAYGAEYL